MLLLLLLLLVYVVVTVGGGGVIIVVVVSLHQHPLSSSEQTWTAPLCTYLKTLPNVLDMSKLLTYMHQLPVCRCTYDIGQHLHTRTYLHVRTYVHIIISYILKRHLTI